MIPASNKKNSSIDMSNFENQLNSTMQTLDSLNNEEKPFTKKQDSNNDKSENDTIIVRLPKGTKQGFKEFCVKNRISMNTFVMFSMDYVKDCCENGKLNISKMGIKA